MKTILKNHFILILVTTFSIIGCKEEPCENTICLNGGECIEGNCNCENGWGGSDCSEQVIPNSYYIKSISFKVNDTLNQFGEPHDIGPVPNKYPDVSVYFSSESWSDELLTLSGDAIEVNAEPFVFHELKFTEENHNFNVNELITITVLDRFIDGELYEATVMNKFEFYPYDNENKTNTRILESAEITLTIELDPVW